MSSHLVTARFTNEVRKILIIQCCAMTNDAKARQQNRIPQHVPGLSEPRSAAGGGRGVVKKKERREGHERSRRR